MQRNTLAWNYKTVVGSCNRINYWMMGIKFRKGLLQWIVIPESRGSLFNRNNFTTAVHKAGSSQAQINLPYMVVLSQICRQSFLRDIAVLQNIGAVSDLQR